MTSDKQSQQDKNFDFETGMKRLQEVVELLEAQELPLEKAVALFEEGMQLSKQCAKILDEAEKRIKMLLKDQETGDILEQDFDEQADINS
ncbi:MAG: exodeoxyribonuclease VII small subunit [Thermodesulfobacteria bacterium]|nr:exodeoxyribonuclease VII small subunit [Thermodesulfobacteriota bacterium]